MKNLNVTQLVLGAVLAIGLSACGKIPEAYRGSFQDTATGTKLKLESDAGSLTFTDGRTITAKADAIKVEDILAGKPGIYLKTKGGEKNFEVYFLFPNATTRKEEQGIVWFTGEVAYTRMADQKEKVQQIKMLHCTDGQIIIDLMTKEVQGGCPATANDLDLVRKE